MSTDFLVVAGSTEKVTKVKFHTSEREMIQDDLTALISELGYNAPYGILTSLKTLPRGGKARVISFGMARTLDAELIIWSPKKFTLKTQGALSRYFQSDYGSFDAVAQDLKRAVGK